MVLYSAAMLYYAGVHGGGSTGVLKGDRQEEYATARVLQALYTGHMALLCASIAYSRIVFGAKKHGMVGICGAVWR